ncbi:MAG: carboxypeptidase regulatory-like domain-containing protein [Bacteroidota bacterium]
MRKVRQLISFFLFMVVLFSSQVIYSQVTTVAAINGTVLDQTGNALPGVNIIAVHVPSGTQYGTISRADGKYNLIGLRVGGPYRVTVSMVGYTTQKEEGFSLIIGQNLKIDFTLPEQAVELKGVTVTAERGSILNAARTGAATNVAKEAVQTLPTINRRIEDVARLTPQYSPSGFGYSFAGQDNRLNNTTIDGSYFNNSFGLAGQPGDRTGVAPISLDAIEQVQVNIAPYDVRQGNFVGATINAVTKSGTNEFSGSAYYYFRDQSLVGTKAKSAEVSVGTFKYNLGGFRLGGPIIKNKLFFFVSYENDKVAQPGTTYLANTGGQPISGNITRVLASDLDQLSSFLKTKFGYETGPYQGYDFATPATRFLAKFDYSLNDRNKISLRYIQLDSETDVLMSNSSSLGFGSRRSSVQALNFQNSNYIILENIRSIVGEWNSVVSENMSNNLIVGYTYNDESRKSRGTFFPMVDILNGGSTYTSFGFEPFTPNNELRYSSFQLQNNFTIYTANHNFTFGLSAERYKSENIFFPGSQSIYVYNSLADFYTDANDYLANPNRTTSPITLRRFQVRWSNIPGQDKPIQPLKVFYTGVYAQDEWQVNKDLKLTAGLRVDVPFFGDTGYENAKADALTFRDENGNAVQYSTKKLPNANILWSPRVGFNWDVSGDRSTQLRGGTGIFTARTMYVWISNQIGNTGVLTGFEQLDNTKARPFNPDPNRYKPTNVTGAPASSYELSLTDKNYKFPQLWRTNFAVDQSLPFGLVGTAEFIYNRDVNGLYYINANLPAAQTAFTGVDNRPRWTNNRINSNVANAIVLKNQNVGYSWNITASLEKPFSDGWMAKLAYNYGVAKNTIDPGSIASGSWFGNATPGDPNNPGVGFSATSPGHRILGAVSYRAEYFDFGSTTISLFWDAYTQGNTSYTFSGDLNGDGGFSNDLIYIPKNTSEMNFEQYTYTDPVTKVVTTFTPQLQAEYWDMYINQDSYLSKNRGKYAERNAVFLPIISRIDLSIVQEVFTNFLDKRNTLQFRADILNVGNLINKNWGVGKSLFYNQPLIARGADSQGRAQYRLRNVGDKLISPETLKDNAGIGDVYRIQLSIRYIFN